MVSIAICTFNGVNRILMVLNALLNVKYYNTPFEVLIIDNNSTDGTNDLCNAFAKKKLSFRIRIVKEYQQGLSYCRAKASKEAEGDTIVFLDDDNIPSPNIVAEASKRFTENPRLGVMGFRVVPRWAVPPSPLVVSVAPFALAIQDLGTVGYQYKGKYEGPVGAGMCVNKALLVRIFSNSEIASRISDRKGDSLIGGGDTLISLMAHLWGFECWYNPEVTIEHVIPEGRMKFEYLQHLFEGIGRGQAALRRIADRKARTFFALGIALKDFVRSIALEKKAATNIDDTERQVTMLKIAQVNGRISETLNFRR